MIIFKCSESIVVVVSTSKLAGHVNTVVKPDENNTICVKVLNFGLFSVTKSVIIDTGPSYGTPWRESSETKNLEIVHQIM